MRLRRVLVSGAIVTCAFSPTLVSAATTTTTSLVSTCTAATIRQWSVDYLINENVVLSIPAPLVDQVQSTVAAAGYGGLLLLGSTGPATLAGSLARLRAAEPKQQGLLVMSDNEGGGVWRLGNLVPTLPWAKTMASYGTATIRSLARSAGTRLAALGINVDLAPVADVDPSLAWPGPANADGLRSFSGAPSVAAADVVAFSAGLRDAGVLPVVKHFPGLGQSTGNSDFGAVRTLPWATLQQRGLPPFVAAVQDGAQAIMVANAVVPGLTTGPATLSPAVAQYARRTLHFDGLLMTDSLGAGAISAAGYSPATAAAQAIISGEDMVLGGGVSSAAAAIQLALSMHAAEKQAWIQGRLSTSRLVDAALHVLTAAHATGCRP